MKEIELAWLAGIMEGEGTFSIYHQKINTNHAKNGQLRGTVSLTNTDPFMINKAVEIFKSMGVNVSIHSYDNKKGSTKTVYDVATSKFSNVKKICENLLPYLVGEKKAKATMLLNFVSQRLDKGHGQYDDDDWNHFKNFRSSETTRETLNRDEDIVQ